MARSLFLLALTAGVILGPLAKEAQGTPVWKGCLFFIKDLTISVIYDNNPYDPRLGTAWGFSCLIEGADLKILFDTGGDGPLLLRNMDALGIRVEEIEAVVLSHVHGDHTGDLRPCSGGRKGSTCTCPSPFPRGSKTISAFQGRR